MPDLTPIPTAYNGHLFRSRLEARWAVFFDALGVRFEYESEGYDLDGTWYLPDFWLPEVECYVEIKPAPAIDPDDPNLDVNVTALRLAVASGRRVLVIYGQPWPDDYGVAIHGPDYVFWFPMQFGLARKDARALWLTGRHGALCLNPSGLGTGYPEAHDQHIQDAYRAARSARFEHGESGRTL